MKKTAALFLFVAVLCTVLPSCSPNYQKGSDTVLLTIGDVEITEEQFRYVSMKNRAQMQGQDPHYFFPNEIGKKRLEELEQRVFKELRFYCAIEILAKEYGTLLSKDDQKLIKKSMKENKKSYPSEEEYYKSFEKYYMTENVFYEQAVNYYLNRNLFYYWSAPQNGHVRLSDQDLFKDIENHFFAAAQILFTGDEAEKEAEDVLKQLDHGEDFLMLAEKYSKDQKKDVRHFAEGEMQEFFEESVKSLEPNSYSQVIKSEMGCHIILRVPLDWEYINKNLETFRDTDLVRLFNEMVQKRADSLEIVYRDAYTGLISE